MSNRDLERHFGYHDGSDDCDGCGETLDRCSCRPIPLEGDARESANVRTLAEFWRIVDAHWTPCERVAMSYLLTDGG